MKDEMNEFCPSCSNLLFKVKDEYWCDRCQSWIFFIDEEVVKKNGKYL